MTTLARRTDVDRQVGLLHNKYWQEALDAAHRKDIILVEGEDDRITVEGILNKRSPTWPTRLKVIAAGSRDNVLGDGRRRCEARNQRPTLIVDRDAWTDAEVQAQLREHESLHITDGWCLESIFLAPTSLRSYDPRLADAVATERERWLRAGALWWTLQRARDAQQRWQLLLGGSFGMPHADLDVDNATALAGALTRRIPEPMRQTSLDIASFAAAYEQRLTAVHTWPEDQQWRLGIHGKYAFRHLLLPALQQLCGPGDWRLQLAAAVRRPPPFDTLLATLLP